MGSSCNIKERERKERRGKRGEERGERKEGRGKRGEEREEQGERRGGEKE